MKIIRQIVKVVDVIVNTGHHRIEISLTEGVYEARTFKRINIIQRDSFSSNLEPSQDAQIFRKLHGDSIKGTSLEEVESKAVDSIDDKVFPNEEKK